jgi:hypothetical protein
VRISTLLVEPVPTVCLSCHGYKFSKRSDFVDRVTIRVATIQCGSISAGGGDSTIFFNLPTWSRALGAARERTRHWRICFAGCRRRLRRGAARRGDVSALLGVRLYWPHVRGACCNVHGRPPCWRYAQNHGAQAPCRAHGTHRQARRGQQPRLAYLLLLRAHRRVL